MLSIQQIPVANTMERRLSIRTQMEENKLIGNPFVRICVTNSYTDNKAMILVLLLLLCFHPFLSLSLPFSSLLSGSLPLFIHSLLSRFMDSWYRHRLYSRNIGRSTQTEA